jgi:hypothetical protein
MFVRGGFAGNLLYGLEYSFSAESAFFYIIFPAYVHKKKHSGAKYVRGQKPVDF